MNNPFAQLGLGQLANTATNPYYSQQAQQGYTQQQLAAMQAQQLRAFNMYAQQQVEMHKWVIDGRHMTMKQFADTLWPEDCPDRTMFYLKYSK